jgi:hypothetical protein
MLLVYALAATGSTEVAPLLQHTGREVLHCAASGTASMATHEKDLSAGLHEFQGVNECLSATGSAKMPCCCGR